MTPDPQRILLLASEFPPFGGGISTYTAELAAAAQRLGHTVKVLAPDLREDQTAFDEQFDFEVIRYAGTCKGNRRTWSAYSTAWKLLRAERFDQVHAVDPIFANFLTVARGLLRIPFLWTVHGSEILMAFTTLEGRFSRFLGTFHSSARIVTNSEYTRGLLLERFPSVHAGKVQVTLLGVSDWWHEEVPAQDVRSAYSIAPEKHVLLTAARLTPRKGQNLVLQALKDLPEEHKQNLCYVLVGVTKDERYARDLWELADVSGVQVVFTGPVSREELRAWYDTAWVHCMPGGHDPSVVEGLGLAYLEAAARGCPSIGGRMGGIPEVIQDGVTGLLLEELTPEVLGSVLVRLLTENGLRDRLAEAAIPFSREFSWDRCAQKTYSSS